jgi:hypothetical protein
MSNPFPVDRTIIPPATFKEIKANTFIYERPNTIPKDWCDEIVRRFEAQPEHHKKGVIGQQGGLDTGIKRTMDMVISDKDDWSISIRCFSAASVRLCKR